MKKVIIGTLIISFIFFSCSCSATIQDKDGYNTTVLRVSSGVTFAYTVQQIMRIEQFLEKQLSTDVTVEWLKFGSSSSDVRDALISNKLDIAAISYTSYITAIENGVPLVLLSGTIPQPVALYSTRSEIESFNDIKQQHKIGMLGKGTNTELTFLMRCKEVLGDTVMFNNNIVNITDSDMLTMIQGVDSYDLYAVGFPIMQKMANISNAKLIEDITETAAKYGVGLVFITTEDFYENNATIVGSFRKASEETVEYINENQDVVALKLSELYGEVTQEEVLVLLKKCPADLRITNYDKIVDVLHETGIVINPARKFSDLPYYEEIPK